MSTDLSSHPDMVAHPYYKGQEKTHGLDTRATRRQGVSRTIVKSTGDRPKSIHPPFALGQKDKPNGLTEASQTTLHHHPQPDQAASPWDNISPAKPSPAPAPSSFSQRQSQGTQDRDQNGPSLKREHIEGSYLIDRSQDCLLAQQRISRYTADCLRIYPLEAHENQRFLGSSSIKIKFPSESQRSLTSHIR
jgi:hypothetical protein